jgi:hypothetical protein
MVPPFYRTRGHYISGSGKAKQWWAGPTLITRDEHLPHTSSVDAEELQGGCMRGDYSTRGNMSGRWPGAPLYILSLIDVVASTLTKHRPRAPLYILSLIDVIASTLTRCHMCGEGDGKASHWSNGREALGANPPLLFSHVGVIALVSNGARIGLTSSSPKTSLCFGGSNQVNWAMWAHCY